MVACARKKTKVNKNTILHVPYFFPFLSEKCLMQNVKEYNRTTSRFEAHLVYKHTQKPNFLISNARNFEIESRIEIILFLSDTICHARPCK